jgi:hypothetical protein
MKTMLRVDMRQTEKLEMQLLCNCCDQPYYPDKAWEDRLRATVFGAEQYAICPLCTQQVPTPVLADEGYRTRCRDTVEKWRALFLAEKGGSRATPQSAPTYEELRAEVVRLERQSRTRLRFKISEKGAVSVYGLGRFPVTLYYEQWVRLLGSAENLRRFLEANKADLKLRKG